MTSWTTELLNGRDHPLRRALVEELHLRRFPSFSAPMRMIQIVMHTGENSGSEAWKHALDLCHRIGAALPKEKERYLHAQGRDFHFVWEQHTEFYTYSFICEAAFPAPFGLSVLDELPEDWVRNLPGQTVRATRIALLSKDSEEPSVKLLASLFGMDDLVCCDVLDGEARIWSNFRVHDDGFGRLLVRDQRLQSAGDTSRLIQRLQELGNYRNMALLGLPTAQRCAPSLLSLEQGLAELAHEIADGRAADERLLHDLSILSAKLAQLTSNTRYRIRATRAYAQLVDDRLKSIRERRIPGCQTLSDFTERRFVPAVRTCDSFSQRTEDLLQRASHASALLRTRIETLLERQTRDLLCSMDKRTHLQIRLQETLEGASVFAISYYAVGLLGYLTKPITYLATGLISTLIAAGTPLIVLASWIHVRRLRSLVRTAAASESAAVNVVHYRSQ